VAARTAVVEEEPEVVTKEKVKPAAKDANGAASDKPAVGRNRSTMARSSNRVGGRLRELDSKPAGRSKPSSSKPTSRQKPDKKGASEPAEPPKFTSRRVTPKSGDGKGKRK
jgi:hypothetical protein